MDQARTQLSAREETLLRQLARRKFRQQQGLFLAEGVRLVEELLASPVRIAWVATSSSLEDTERGRALGDVLEARRVPRRELSEAELRRLADTETPQGVLAVAEIPEASLAVPEAPGVVLVLDAVQDPGNFGTLARTAEALGVGALLALPGTVDPWNPKAVRAAMGASFRLPIVSAPWPEARDRLRGAGYAVYAAAAGGGPVGPAAGARVALVVGNEGAGISPEVLADADREVGIPLRGRAESLNVAAAAAILLHELLR